MEEGADRLRIDRSIGAEPPLVAGSCVAVTYTLSCTGGAVHAPRAAQQVPAGWRFASDLNPEWSFDEQTRLAVTPLNCALQAGQQSTLTVHLIVEAHHPAHILPLPSIMLEAVAPSGVEPALALPDALAPPPLSVPVVHVGDPGQDRPGTVAVGVANGSAFPVDNITVNLKGTVRDTRHLVQPLAPGERFVLALPVEPDETVLTAQVVQASNHLGVPIPPAAFAATVTLCPPASSEPPPSPAASYVPEDDFSGAFAEDFSPPPAMFGELAAPPASPVATLEAPPAMVTGLLAPAPVDDLGVAAGGVDIAAVELADPNGRVAVGHVIEVQAHLVNGTTSEAGEVTVIGHLPSHVSVRDDRWSDVGGGQVAFTVTALPGGHGVKVPLRLRLDRRGPLNIRFEARPV